MKIMIFKSSKILKKKQKMKKKNQVFQVYL